MTDQENPAALAGSPSPKAGPRRRFGLVARLRNYFLTGLIVVAPVALTIYVTWLFIDFVDSKVKLLIPHDYDPAAYLPFTIPGLGLVVMVVVLTLIGFVAVTYLGRGLVSIGEAIVGRMPVVRGVYAAFKQIFETVFGQSSKSFREVVLVQPTEKIWALGFITSTARNEIHDKTSPEVVHVFVPTTPNPTSGFLLFIPRSDLIHLDMSVEDGIKLVVSGGIVTPPAPGVAAANGRLRGGRRDRSEEAAAESA